MANTDSESSNAVEVASTLEQESTYETLLEFNKSLRRFNTLLESNLDKSEKTLERVEGEKTRVEGEKALVEQELSTLRGNYSSLQEQLANSLALQREDSQQKKGVEKLQKIVDQSVDKLKNIAARCDPESCVLYQDEKIQQLEEQLASAEEKLKLSCLSTSVFEEQKAHILMLESKVIEGENFRKKLHNTIMELKGNIRVFCRVRPFLTGDGVGIISFPTSTELVGRGIDITQNGKKTSFTFDKVFMPDASQEEVFVEISQLVQSALDGFMVCIFAYGQTGSGKTYTMMGKPGSPDEKGLIPRTLEQVFETRHILEAHGWNYEMKVSMLEIYNETIHDLLAPNIDASRSGHSKKHNIIHESNDYTHVSDLTIVDVRSSKEVSSLLHRAAQIRSVGKTDMNEQSSRSHFVLKLQIVGFNESTNQRVRGVLNLIDLAGSERLSTIGSVGPRLKETQAINRSLSALTDVIIALVNKDEHVPYRNSKLTYLLQPCLGGDSKTLMFVNLSPEPSFASESLCSLRFAARVKECKTGSSRSEAPNRGSTFKSPRNRCP